MKALAPQTIIIQLYRCEYCEKEYGAKKAEKHEAICYKNPNRSCRICENTGVNQRTKETCDACLIAQKLGGKSYVL